MDQSWMVYLRENVSKKFNSPLEAVNEALGTNEEDFTNFGNSCPLFEGCIIVGKNKFVGFFKEKNAQGDFVVVSVNSKKAIGLIVVNKNDVKAVRYPVIP